MRSEKEKRYALDAGDYKLLSEWGDGVCWICQEPEVIPGRSLAVDHCHQLGVVRGLLCTRCNQTLGRMNDRADWLRRAADYLERTRTMFGDMCQDCPLEESQIHGWDSIVERDGDWTVFRYRCQNDHVWTCGYRTAGALWMWS